MNINFTKVLLLTLTLSGCATNAPQGPSMPQGALRQAQDDIPIPHHDVGALRSILAQYDRQIEALRSTLDTPAFGNSTAQINNSISALRAGIAQSASDVNSLIAQKAQVYAAREDRVVSSLLADARVSAPSGDQVKQHVEQAYRAEYSRLRTGADADMNAYTRALLAQEQQAYAAFVQSVQYRTQLAYTARSEELREKESALLLDLARQDAGRRLQLRAKLQTLALRASDRAAIAAQLRAIQNRENPIVTAQQLRDNDTLRSYRNTLLANANRDVAAMAAQLLGRTQANLAARRDVFVAQRAAGHGLSMKRNVGPPARSGDLSTEVAAMRAQGADAFRADADETVTEYLHARDAIDTRFAAVRDADATATSSTRSAIAQLERDRNALEQEIAMLTARR